MKKLQNNFTTTEQSKRLLELGVPAWTADCWRWFDEDNPLEINVRSVQEDLSNNFFNDYTNVLPCWSVGRLIEIHRICSTLPDEEYMFPFWKDQEYNVEWAIRVLESGIRTGNIDFSNLEE